jgi:PAS domain S-box-containing protein
MSVAGFRPRTSARPARCVASRIENGVGTVMDDWIAGAYACVHYSLPPPSFPLRGWVRLALFEDFMMEQKKDWIKAREALRAEADKALSSLPLAGMAAKPAETMLHELLVHKFELEMQIDELKRTYAELEEARDHYLEYYECASIGYLTIDREGRIAESNLTGAALLGVERAAQTGQHLAQFVSTRDQDRWHRVFMEMLENPEIEQLGVVLEMTRPDRTTFDAYLDCRRLQPPDALPTVRVTLVDIAKIKEAEAETGIAAVPSAAQQ